MRTFIAATNEPNVLNRVTGEVTRAVGNGVMGALQRASEATGVDFNYLVRTATRESSLNPGARAPTSSAAGLFQFIEQTWLGTLKAHGARHGYGAYADQITKGRDGRYHVNDPAARRQVLGLRYDAQANALMGAELTAGHAAYLKGRIGRDPTQGELYAAHFLGPEGAASLITTSQVRPNAIAANLFPAAARANRSLFYSHGQPLSVTAVMANLTRTGGAEPMTVREAEPVDDLGGNPMIVARMDKVRSDQAILNLVFGNDDGQQGMLFATQLMSAFGPGEEGDGDGKPGDFGKAFGNLMG